MAGTLLEIRKNGSTPVIGFQSGVKELPNREEVSTVLLRELAETLGSLAPQPAMVILSLEGIRYLGNNPLAVLFEIHSGSRANPPRYPAITLTDIGEQPQKKLTTVGLIKVIPTYPTVNDALASASGSSDRAA